MTGDPGRTQFHLAGGGNPFDELLRQVQAAAQGVYDVLGEMGRSRSGNVVYLARELESSHLVALKLTRTGPSDEYALEVVRTLDTTVPGLENTCPECKTVLPDWDRFCFHCGADLTAGSPPAGDEADSMLEAVREATRGTYEVLGQMNRSEGGGSVYFARDLERGGKLVALRLRRDEAGDPSQAAYSIGETQVLRPLAAELGQTQVLGAAPLFPDAPPLAPPPVPPAPPQEPPRTRGGREPAGKALLAALGRVPKAARWGIGGGVAMAVLVALALSGGGDDLSGTTSPPPPPPADTIGTASDTLDASADSVLLADPPPPPVATPAAPDSATVRLVTDLPAGAVFTIDGGRVRGTSVRLASGRHTLSVIVPGVAPVTQRVTLRAGQVFRWAPALEQAVVVTPPPAPRPPPPPPPATCARTFSRSDWTQASQLCLTEANAGGREAQRMLARMLELGNGMPQDRAQAAVWYLKAAAAGDREAQMRLGYLYRNGTGVSRDETESARWFRLAAAQGDPVAQVEYGVALENGDGVRKNEAEAATWYRKAADAGSAAGFRLLGRLYERGRGVEKSEAEAVRYWLEAAGRNDPEAMYLLGRAYKDGRGVEKSRETALDWFRKGAAAGHRGAADEARKLEQT